MDDAKLERMLNNIIDALARVEKTFKEINDDLKAMRAEFKAEVGRIRADVGKSIATVRGTTADASEIKADIAAIRADLSELTSGSVELRDEFVKINLGIDEMRATIKRDENGIGQTGGNNGVGIGLRFQICGFFENQSLVTGY